MTKGLQKKVKEFLKGVGILSSLTDDELDLVWNIAKPVEIPANKVIIIEGEIGDMMYLFAEGEVNVTKNLTLKLGKKGFSSAEKSMVKLDSKKVSFFGEMAMFEESPRSATITASTRCLLYAIKRKDFEKLCFEHPEIGYKILREIAVVLCRRIRKGNQDVLKLSTALSIALSST
ncbi:MAG: cyclic nucleotide-binding domain-containing protein [Spirochaetales bacterium]|nr:cyclic nucleotide-binding domain-containing protein [Spirochaetales bacterium]